VSWTGGADAPPVLRLGGERRNAKGVEDGGKSAGCTMKKIPQRLKPQAGGGVTARLKPCPSETMQTRGTDSGRRLSKNTSAAKAAGWWGCYGTAEAVPLRKQCRRGAPTAAGAYQKNTSAAKAAGWWGCYGTAEAVPLRNNADAGHRQRPALIKKIPQRLKPPLRGGITARLKPCPSETMQRWGADTILDVLRRKTSSAQRGPEPS
jgi:hypothetical protein